MPEPDFMHGSLDIWPVLEGAVAMQPHVVGDVKSLLYLPDEGDSDIGMFPYVSGDVRVDLHLGGKLEVNR